MQNQKTHPVIRASGIYDVVLLLAFAIPSISAWTLAKLRDLNEVLSLPGKVPEFSPFAMLFVNMMATLAILYSTLRIREPNRFYGGYDVIARCLMAFLMLVYLVLFKVAGILWVFLVAELAWAAVQYKSLSPR